MGWKEMLFPPACMGCGALGSYVCSRCINTFALIDTPICPLCVRPSMHGMTHARCVRPQAMNGMIAGFRYQGIVKRLLTKYKYAMVTDLTETLVEAFISMVDMTPLIDKDWVVVPVPLHPRRERWRGYNQAALLGRALADIHGWKLETASLVRTRYTTPQMKLERKQRMHNVSNVFGKGKEARILKGRRVLLIDDVWTTGATMRACARVLKRSGCGDVWGVVWGR